MGYEISGVGVEAATGLWRVADCIVEGKATSMPGAAGQMPWEVLVVDDEESIRELILSYFKALDVPVTAAPDGAAAIGMLQRSGGRFGMVVTDLALPGADGFAVLQAAKQANSQCHVVIVTGYASVDSAVHAVRVGAYDYLTKPFSLAQLDVVLTRITDRIRTNAASVSAPLAGLMPPPGPVVGSRIAVPPGAPVDSGIARIEATLARIEARLEKLSAHRH